MSALLLAAGLCACGEKLEGHASALGGSDDDDDRPPVPDALDLSTLADVSGLDPAQLTFTSIHEEILEPGCATSLCHASTAFGNAHLTGLDLTRRDPAYVQLMRNSIQWIGWKRIVPGDPEHSYVLAKLMRHPAIDGTVMPPPPNKALDDNALARIAQWIRLGALDN